MSLLTPKIGSSIYIGTLLDVIGILLNTYFGFGSCNGSPVGDSQTYRVLGRSSLCLVVYNRKTFFFFCLTKLCSIKYTAEYMQTGTSLGQKRFYQIHSRIHANMYQSWPKKVLSFFWRRIHSRNFNYGQLGI